MTAPSPGRALRRRAQRLAEAFLRERGLLPDDLDAPTRAILRQWSEAETRLRSYDDKGEFDRWHVAAQNSATRLLRDLEEQIAASQPAESLDDIVARFAGDDVPVPEPLARAEERIRA